MATMENTLFMLHFFVCVCVCVAVMSGYAQGYGPPSAGGRAYGPPSLGAIAAGPNSASPGPNGDAGGLYQVGLPLSVRATLPARSNSSPLRSIAVWHR